jgi:short-subunit dehydrogenase
MQVAGSTVVVTGASGGLGRAIARTLGAHGACLVLHGRDAGRLDPLAAELGAEVVRADLATDTDALLPAVADADVLVLGAAVDGGATVEQDSQVHIDQVLDVNLRSPLVLATEFAQSRLRAGRPGQVVLVGSVSGLAPTPLFRLYNATKFGLRGFGLALRQDLRPHGIGVTVITPGYIRDAGMTVDSGVSLPWYARTRSPEDVADAVVSAIRRDPAEIYVAPLELRVAALGATVAPGLAAWAHRRIGIDKAAHLAPPASSTSEGRTA